MIAPSPIHVGDNKIFVTAGYGYGSGLFQVTNDDGEFGLELLMPVRHVREGDRIVEILGEKWEEGDEQIRCVLSGNSLDEDGNVTCDPAQVERYFSEFGRPMARKVIQTYLSGEALGEVL